MVHGRADDDHRLALGLVSVIGKLARNGNDLVTLYASDLFLPGGGVRGVVVVAQCRVLARDPTGNAVVGHSQVEHSGDQRITLFSGLTQFDATHWHLAHQNVINGCALLVSAEVGSVNATKIREADFSDFVIGGHSSSGVFHQTQFELDV